MPTKKMAREEAERKALKLEGLASHLEATDDWHEADRVWRLAAELWAQVGRADRVKAVRSYMKVEEIAR